VRAKAKIRGLRSREKPKRGKGDTYIPFSNCLERRGEKASPLPSYERKMRRNSPSLGEEKGERKKKSAYHFTIKSRKSKKERF